MNAQIKDNGLSYIGDEKDGAVSVYRLQLEGRHLFDVLVDNVTEIDAETAEKLGLTAPEGATLHPLAVASPDRKAVVATNGVGAKVAHMDEHGVSAPHIDGMTVAHFILPRATRFLGLLLEARSAL